MAGGWLLIGFGLLLAPFYLLVCLVLLLATFGLSLGIRHRYVAVLRAIFRWGRRELSVPHAGGRTDCDGGGSDEDSDGPPPPPSDDERDPSPPPARKRTVHLIEHAAGARLAAKLAGGGRPARSPMAAADDSWDFIKCGVESIVEDEVTRRFVAQELASWNMLTRTSAPTLAYAHVSWRLGLLWLCGVALRYCVLLPARLLVMSAGLLFILASMSIVAYIPEPRLRDWAYCAASTVACRIYCRSISAIVNFHDRHNAPQRQGICVANHTSPLDCLVLGADSAYAFIGQRHGGVLGVVQRALGKAARHIWFERGNAGDRSQVLASMRSHVSAARSLPILIFPEGTCINNTSVMMFKKGSFEVDATIYPVAIKYDPTFGDAFWNSSQQSFAAYWLMMMTSWAIVADVWYLPPCTRLPSESSIGFAQRVKSSIAAAGGLVELEWDGNLKRAAVPDKMRSAQRLRYTSARLAAAATDATARPPQVRNTNVAGEKRADKENKAD